MAWLRMFGPIREAAGTGMEQLPGQTVHEVITAARDRHGEAFTAVASGCRVWLNGEEAAEADLVSERDEVALIPPAAGGSV